MLMDLLSSVDFISDTIHKCLGPHNIYELYGTGVSVWPSSKSLCSVFTVGEKLMVQFKVKEKSHNPI